MNSFSADFYAILLPGSKFDIVTLKKNLQTFEFFYTKLNFDLERKYKEKTTQILTTGRHITITEYMQEPTFVSHGKINEICVSLWRGHYPPPWATLAF